VLVFPRHLKEIPFHKKNINLLYNLHNINI